MTASAASLEGAEFGIGHDEVGTISSAVAGAETTSGIPIGVPALAARWADAVVAAGDHGLCPDDIAVLLGRMAERLAAALTAEPFSAAAGREVGAELVGARLTGAASIGASVTVLADLPAAVIGRPGADPGTAAARLPALLGDLVTGYAAALRACTMEELDRRGTGRRGELQREAHVRLRAIFSGVETALAICAPDGRILETNPAFVQMLRHRVAYLHTHSVYDVVHPDDAAVLAKVVEVDLLTAGHRRVLTEVRLRRRRGSAIPVRLALSIVHGEDGRPAYLVVAGSGAPRHTAPASEPVPGDTRIDLTRVGLVPAEGPR